MIFGNKVLVIAAHPDDEVLGAGGTILKLINADVDVEVLIVTDGSSSQYQDDREILEKKHDESARALKKLGVSRYFQWSFPDMRLDSVPHVELNRELEKFIYSSGYDTVLCQDNGDVNMDHTCLFNSVRVAVRPHPKQNVKVFMTYYVNSSSEWGGIMSGSTFSPNIFVNIDDFIEDKLSSMAEYVTELREYPHPRSLKSIKTSAEYFGNMVGHRNAEAFRLIYSR